ncbi:Transmembrane protein 184A [Durusdinium trenchii]|uniref:Transmembrane protein 184A n=1 Tax=Durusdinium trenchii TaxID=1381693 RepID=A0ABP0IKH5_9DINO
MTGLTIVLNQVFAPMLLGEKLTRVEVIGTAIIILGVILTSTSAGGNPTTFNVCQLVARYADTDVLVVVFFFVGAIALNIFWVHGGRHPPVLEKLRPEMYAFVAGGLGGLMNVAFKATGELAKGEVGSASTNTWATIWPYFHILAVAVLAIGMISYINRGLQHYDAVLFTPLYFTNLIICSTTLGMVYYREYQNFKTWQLAVFPIGISIVVCGILFMTLRGVDVDVVRARMARLDQSKENRKSMASLHSMGSRKSAASFSSHRSSRKLQIPGRTRFGMLMGGLNSGVHNINDSVRGGLSHIRLPRRSRTNGNRTAGGVVGIIDVENASRRPVSMAALDIRFLLPNLDSPRLASMAQNRNATRTCVGGWVGGGAGAAPASAAALAGGASKPRARRTDPSTREPARAAKEANGREMATPTATPTESPTPLAPTGTLAPTLNPSAQAIDDFVTSKTAVTIAFVCAMLAVVISGWNIFQHLVHYNEPKQQKFVVRILLIVPIYAVFSFLSLSISSAHVFIDIIRDVYEAFVVYCFLSLMLIYCGGENACLSVIMHDPGSITHVWPFNWCVPDIALTSRFLRLCKQWTLQFVIVKPVMAGINLFMVATESEDAKGWEITQAIIYNISYTAALYALLLFYKATHNHPTLKVQYPVLKFLSVKLVVFATYYQTVLVGITPDVPQESLEALNSFLLCCEMVIFAALQYCAFPWKYYAGLKSSPHIASRSDSTFDDVGIEVHELGRGNGAVGGGASALSSPSTAGGEIRSPGSGNNEIALSNAKDVMSMQDVAKDAYYNFSNKYGDHVLLDSNSAQMDDISAAADDQSGTRRSTSRFGRLGTTIKSLRTGGKLEGEDEAMEGANPFGSFHFDTGSTSPSSKTAPSSGGGGVNDGGGGATQATTLDPNLPSYLKERDDAAQGATAMENPFEQDFVDPLGIADPPSSSFIDGDGDDGASNTANTSDWAADFSEAAQPEVMASGTKAATKKKKKGNTTRRSEEPSLPISTWRESVQWTYLLGFKLVSVAS